MRAKNGVGLGVASSDYLVTTDSEPTFASIPVNTTIVEPKRVELTWPAVTDFVETGGDPVISYKLEFDHSFVDGVEDWRVINDPATQGTLRTFTFNSNTVFPSRAVLRFRLACINTIGVGAYSAVGLVQADSVPMQTFPPIVNYPLNHINPRWIYLTWPKLSDATEQSGGDPVVFYKLEGFNSITNVWEELT